MQRGLCYPVLQVSSQMQPAEPLVPSGLMYDVQQPAKHTCFSFGGGRGCTQGEEAERPALGRAWGFRGLGKQQRICGAARVHLLQQLPPRHTAQHLVPDLLHPHQFCQAAHPQTQLGVPDCVLSVSQKINVQPL